MFFTSFICRFGIRKRNSAFRHFPALGGTGPRHDTRGTVRGMLRNDVIFHPVEFGLCLGHGSPMAFMRMDSGSTCTRGGRDRLGGRAGLGGESRIRGLGRKRDTFTHVVRYRTIILHRDRLTRGWE